MARKAALIFVVAAAAWGHHSFKAEYDSDKPVHLEGVVARFDFINPHTEIFLDVGGVRWWIEVASPQMLVRRGISKNTLRAGMRVSIDGFQAKNGSRKAIGRAITFPDGQKILLDASGTGLE